jgi:hypothetical protein
MMGQARHASEGWHLMTKKARSCPEIPASGVPAKYYFAGCPFAGMTGRS